MIIGGLFQNYYVGVDEGAISDTHGAAVSSFIAAAIYAACFSGCLARFLYLRHKAQKADSPKFEVDS